MILSTDASDVGIGAVLSQPGPNGEEEVIAFFSRKLTAPEKNYTVTEREFLAILFGLSKARPFLFNTTVHIFTDHHALRFLLGNRDTTGRLCRWSLALEKYNVRIFYKPGRDNANADALSRLPAAADAVVVDINLATLPPPLRHHTLSVVSLPPIASPTFVLTRGQSALVQQFFPQPLPQPISAPSLPATLPPIPASLSSTDPVPMDSSEGGGDSSEENPGVATTPLSEPQWIAPADSVIQHPMDPIVPMELRTAAQ